MTPQEKDDTLNRADDAINSAMKRIKKDRLKAIVDKVKAMHIPGPTFEEYLENFESQYPLFNETSNIKEEPPVVNTEFIEWKPTPIAGYGIYTEPLAGIGAGTVHTGSLVPGFHSLEKVNIASAQMVNSILFSGMGWSQMIEPILSYKFAVPGIGSFFADDIQHRPPPNVPEVCFDVTNNEDNFDHWPPPSGFLF